MSETIEVESIIDHLPDGSFVRSRPTNSRALWHIVNPDSAQGLTFCSRHMSGPRTNSVAEVTESPWPWCKTCTERRQAAIDQAVRTLRHLAPTMLTGAVREDDSYR